MGNELISRSKKKNIPLSYWKVSASGMGMGKGFELVWSNYYEIWLELCLFTWKMSGEWITYQLSRFE